MDTGGGKCSTVASRAWKVTGRVNHVCCLDGCQNRGQTKKCPIVNTTTKAAIEGREELVLLGMNHAAPAGNEDENDSLRQPFDFVKHGIVVDLVCKHLGGNGGVMIQGNDEEDVFLNFSGEDQENIQHMKINKPTQDEMDALEHFESTSQLPNHAREPRHNDGNRITWGARRVNRREKMSSTKTTQFRPRPSTQGNRARSSTGNNTGSR